jgi:hypothetical protein
VEEALVEGDILAEFIFWSLEIKTLYGVDCPEGIWLVGGETSPSIFKAKFPSGEERIYDKYDRVGLYEGRGLSTRSFKAMKHSKVLHLFPCRLL